MHVELEVKNMINESIIPYLADLCNDSQQSFLYCLIKKVKEKW